jgi:hypothetical protein
MQPVAEPLRNQAGDDVGTAAGRERHDQMDRPIRPVRLAGRRLRGRVARRHRSDQEGRRYAPHPTPPNIFRPNIFKE